MENKALKIIIVPEGSCCSHRLNSTHFLNSNVSNGMQYFCIFKQPQTPTPNHMKLMYPFAMYSFMDTKRY
jgi:hypothetical protein